jgi:hypothetical protein
MRKILAFSAAIAALAVAAGPAKARIHVMGLSIPEAFQATPDTEDGSAPAPIPSEDGDDDEQGQGGSVE